MENSTTLITRRKIASLNTDLLEKMAHLKQLDQLLRWSFVLTFLLYFAFALSLYVGDIFNIRSIIQSFIGGAYSLAFFSVIAALLAYVLAATKHVAYKHFSMFKTVKIIVLLMVFTGILAEVFNSGGVQDSKARAINSGNAEYTALVNEGSAGSIKLDESLTSRIAYAQKVLARCNTNMALGKEKHCNGDQAKLTALLDSQTVLVNAQMKATKDNQEERYKRLDELKNEAYNPVIKTLSKLLNIEIAQAVSLLMLLFAVLFEAMHYYLSIMRENTLVSIKGIEAALERLEIDLIHYSGEYQTGVNITPSDFPEENRTRWNEQNNVTAKSQNFVGFVNPDQPTALRVSNHTSEQPPHAYSTRAGRVSIHDDEAASQDDYERLKQLIIERELSVTYRPIKAWMKSQNIGTSDKNRQNLTVEYLDKMFSEGVLVLNPANDGKGINKAKYICA